MPERILTKCKKLLIKDNYCLKHFDPNLEIIFTSDSSNYGIVSVISHILLDSLERPIAFT